MAKEKKKPWMRFRHRVVRNVLFPTLGTYSRLTYGIHIEKFREQGDRQYLILFNHQTAFDQFFVGIAFRGPVYYLASEDLFSNGWVSSVIRYLVAPIPIKKQTTDIAAVKRCLTVAKEGGTIAIAPEGNRTYSGTTAYINPAIVALAKKLGLPIALYRLEGGYGVQPRWSDVNRRGKMRGYVSEVIEPEEYKAMTNEALQERIEKGLYVNEGVADGIFRHAKRAEYLERAMYVCPTCGLSTFESHGSEITCKRCGLTVQYGEDKRLTGVGCAFPFPFVNEWYAYQEQFVHGLDLTAYLEKPMYQERARLSEVIVYERKKRLSDDTAVALYGDRIVVSEADTPRVFTFEEVSAVTVLGRNKLNIYHDGHVYQLKGDKRFNALKYVNMYYHYKNVSKGDTRGEFLGL